MHTMEDEESSVVYRNGEEYETARRALLQLQENLKAAPEEDWRANLLWHEVEKLIVGLARADYEACEMPHKPADFQYRDPRPREVSPMPTHTPGKAKRKCRCNMTMH
jgi:hypothetical protein